MIGNRMSGHSCCETVADTTEVELSNLHPVFGSKDIFNKMRLPKIFRLIMAVTLRLQTK